MAVSAGRCAICGDTPGRSLCKRCQASYDRDAHDVGDLIEVVLWAATRTRRFERTNARKILRSLVQVCETTITTVDLLMKQPANRARGEALAKVTSALELAKDVAKRYGLAIGARRG